MIPSIAPSKRSIGQSIQDFTNAIEVQTLENHPNYEFMITEALINNIENGVTKQTILNRIKKKYHVIDRYAKPAIKSALKKLREKRKIKRTVDGLYKTHNTRSRSRSRSKTKKS